ncbi:hypothetical protein [Ponticaulis koreensis]|uniref:hypothetical protein n=1 Tax=Ponticaulis koreensis TaxID=1123045 RepID=UPI0012DECF40|nr:hypothetical protein [Ponticaulis koreensis]
MKFVSVTKCLVFCAAFSFFVPNSFAQNCDFQGRYSKTCVRSLESDRVGGVLLIWSTREAATCSQLTDTAEVTAHQFCAVQNGSSSLSSTASGLGGLALQCEGAIGANFASDRDEMLTELLNDGTESILTSGFPSPPEGATLAYSKFVCQ